MVMFGVKINEEMLADEEFVLAIAEDFDCYYPENELKMHWVMPGLGDYDFKPMDKIVEFASYQSARVRGHTLMWHSSIPEWLKNGNYSSEQVWLFVADYIATIIKRYEGKIEFWDVVNEAIDEDGEIRQSFWLEKLGSDWIIKVFKLVRSLTSSKLFYCDYRIKNYKKWERIYELVCYLHSLNLCDGIAIQMQFNTFPPPALQSISYWVDKFKSSKILVHAPEIVVWSRMRTSDHWLVQSSYYYICKTCIHAGAELIGFWALFANHPWHWHSEKDTISWLFDCEYRSLNVWQQIKIL